MQIAHSESLIVLATLPQYLDIGDPNYQIWIASHSCSILLAENSCSILLAEN